MSDPALNARTLEDHVVQSRELQLPGLGAGAHLRMQREALSWSIEQVANQLNLAPRQILALEEDNYTALPGIASARGFIRAYAKLLKIDAAPLLATMPSAMEQHAETLQGRPPLATPFLDTARLPSSVQRSSASRIMLGALLLAALVGAAYGTHQLGLVRIPEFYWLQQNVRAIENEPSSTPEISNPPVVSMAAVNGVDNVDKLGANMVVESGNVALSEGVMEAGQRVAGQVDVVAVADKNGLTIKLREDSWIEIKRLGGGNGANNVVHARLMKAGTTERIDLVGPVALTVGNAAGVDATWRGEPLDLKAGVKSNVARLHLK